MEHEDVITPRYLILKSASKEKVILYLYKLIMTEKLDTDISDKPFCTYGIATKSRECQIIEDVSVDKNFVNSLVDLCNKLELSPLHLFEIVDDSIG